MYVYIDMGLNEVINHIFKIPFTPSNITFIYIHLELQDTPGTSECQLNKDEFGFYLKGLLFLCI